MTKGEIRRKPRLTRAKSEWMNARQRNTRVRVTFAREGVKGNSRAGQGRIRRPTGTRDRLRQMMLQARAKLFIDF